MNDILSLLLKCDVEFLPIGCRALNDIDVQEANNAPLDDMGKVIKYFRESILPFAYDEGESILKQQEQELTEFLNAENIVCEGLPTRTHRLRPC